MANTQETEHTEIKRGAIRSADLSSTITMTTKMMNTYKRELSLSNCGFDHDPADAIVRSQWQSTSHNNWYLLYRWLVAGFVFSVVIVSMCSHIAKGHPLGLFFIYLTHWGIMLNMIVGIFGAVLVTVWHFHTDFQGNKEKRMIHKNTKINV